MSSSGARSCDETAREVVEVALFWGADLLRVAYLPRTARVSFADFHVGEAPGAPVALPAGGAGSRVEARSGAFTLRATVVRAARRFARPWPELPPITSALVAAFLYATVFGALARGAPEPARDDLDLARSYLASSDGAGQGNTADAFDTSGSIHGPTASQAGDERAESTIGVPHGRGAARHADRVLPDAFAPADVSLDEARTFGLIGVLAPGAGDASGPASPWAGPIGDAPLWRDRLDAFGDGPALTGVGEAGGPGAGIAIRGIGALPRGYGVRHPGGESVCRGRLTVTHRAPGPVCTLRFVTPTVPGRLPSEVIQRVVRASFGRFRACYQRGLERDRSLAGRVSTKFVIARDGSVSAVADAGSDLRDPDVVACVVRTFRDLSFPAPPGGVVDVTYPILFSPDG